MPSPKIIIVTGANRGIGLAICNQILSRPDLGPLKLFATSRQGDLSLPSSKTAEVISPRLDVSNIESIRALRDEVKQHGDAVSVLINNAGVNLDREYGVEGVRKTLEVNFRGTVEMCQTFMPLFSPEQGGRIVNLASVASSLKFYAPAIQARFRNPGLTMEELEELAREYEHSVRTHAEIPSGFGPPIRSYAFSKALLRASTTLLAHQNPNPNLLINSCCPGWISTDMGSLISNNRKTKPPKTPDQGAQIPMRLAFDDIQNVSGKYWANDSVRSKESGKVQTEW